MAKGGAEIPSDAKRSFQNTLLRKNIGTVRITEKQRICTREAFEETVPDAEPYLFGSRTDNAARGSDIDLLLLSDQKLSLRSLLTLKRRILGKIEEQYVPFDMQTSA